MSDFSIYIYKIITALQNSEPIVVLPTLIAVFIVYFHILGIFIIFINLNCQKKPFQVSTAFYSFLDTF